MSLQTQIGALTSLYNDGGFKQALRGWWNFRGRWEFSNRARRQKGLVLVVAGYEPRLWPMTLQRLKRHLPPDQDVCLVLPGRHVPQLESIAADYGWSVLATKENKLGLAQNLTIHLHPDAEVITKLDEDVFIAAGFLEGLADALQKTEAGGIHRPGFVAPVLNVNGFTSRILLSELGRLEEFESRFGTLPAACMETPVWRDPEAATFLWEVTAPFDQLAARFLAAPFATSLCHHRFSIGAIMLRRAVWESMGGFSVTAPGVLGAEEGDLCAWCVEHSRAMLIAHRVLAGHAGFQPQLDRLLPLLEYRQDLLLEPHHSDESPA